MSRIKGWKYRVGWVEPHNAYVHMIYRAGVIGIVFIIVIWSLFGIILRYAHIQKNTILSGVTKFSQN